MNTDKHDRFPPEIISKQHCLWRAVNQREPGRRQWAAVMHTQRSIALLQREGWFDSLAAPVEVSAFIPQSCLACVSPLPSSFRSVFLIPPCRGRIGRGDKTMAPVVTPITPEAYGSSQPMLIARPLVKARAAVQFAPDRPEAVFPR